MKLDLKIKAEINYLIDKINEEYYEENLIEKIKEFIFSIYEGNDKAWRDQFFLQLSEKKQIEKYNSEVNTKLYELKQLLDRLFKEINPKAYVKGVIGVWEGHVQAYFMVNTKEILPIFEKFSEAIKDKFRMEIIEKEPFEEFPGELIFKFYPL